MTKSKLLHIWSMVLYAFILPCLSQKLFSVNRIINNINIHLTAFSKTIWVSSHQKGTKTILDFHEATVDVVTVDQLDHMQINSTLLWTDNHASIISLVFMGWMLFVMPNERCQYQSTESLLYIACLYTVCVHKSVCCVTAKVGFAVEFSYKQLKSPLSMSDMWCAYLYVSVCKYAVGNIVLFT